jgi:hypothetical protein
MRQAAHVGGGLHYYGVRPRLRVLAPKQRLVPRCFQVLHEQLRYVRCERIEGVRRVLLGGLQPQPRYERIPRTAVVREHEQRTRWREGRECLRMDYRAHARALHGGVGVVVCDAARAAEHAVRPQEFVRSVFYHLLKRHDRPSAIRLRANVGGRFALLLRTFWAHVQPRAAPLTSPRD